MKVLHVINSLATGGAEKLILETIPKYNERGIHADVLLLNGTEHPFLQGLKEQQCCTVFTLGMGSVYHPKFIWKLIPYFKKYDLVHAHLFPSTYFVAAAKMLSFSSIPIVFTEHSTSNRRFRNPQLRVLNSFVYRNFNRIVCITNEVRQEVIAMTNVRAEKLVVINNAVDIQKISEAQTIGRNDLNIGLLNSDVLLLQVSSFRFPKDQKTVISSLQYLPANVKLLLAGEGVLKEECISFVQKLKLGNRVIFFGNRNDIPALFKSIDIGILSSSYEGFGLVAVEGMASGKPFIASDVPGLAGVVGGYGILFPQGDSHALADEILKLMNNKALYDETGLKCAARAKDFDVEKMIDQHITLYKNLISTRV